LRRKAKFVRRTLFFFRTLKNDIFDVRNFLFQDFLRTLGPATGRVEEDPDFGAKNENLGAKIRNRGAENWNLGAEIWNRGAKNRNLGAKNWNLGAENWNLGAKNRNLGAENWNRGAKNWDGIERIQQKELKGALHAKPNQ
jgi:hypothetical protein